MGARAGEWVILASAEEDGELTRIVRRARGDGGWPEFELELVGAEGGPEQIPSSLGAQRGRRLGKRRGGRSRLSTQGQARELLVQSIELMRGLITGNSRRNLGKKGSRGGDDDWRVGPGVQ